MNNPGPLFRSLFKHLITEANLPRLIPRPLKPSEIVAGLSEFVVTRADDLPGGGWSSAGLLVPRAYMGYVAVHYAQNVDQHDTFADEAAIFRALVTFEMLPAVAAQEAFRTFGNTPSNWFLNTVPEQASQPPVLTLVFDWQMDIDLTLKEAPPQ